MSRQLSPFLYLYLLSGLIVAVAGWLGLMFLPDNAYARYVELKDTDYIKGRWIYERVNFDPTPVDVAFLGTSHTMLGVDSVAVEKVLNEGSAKPVHVVNFALPSPGRDFPYELGRMLIEKKHPKLLFIELDYLEGRPAHVAFPLVADAEDALSAPIFVNSNMGSNLFRVPARHFMLFWKSLFEGAPRFDPAAYAGPHWDDTYRITAAGGVMLEPRTWHSDRAELLLGTKRWIDPRKQAASRYEKWGWIASRVNEFYLHKLIDLAQKSGTRVVLFYVQPFQGPEEPFNAAALRQQAEIWRLPEEFMNDPTLWANATHLNYFGARKLSAWLGRQLGSGPARTAGLEPRSVQ